MKLSADAILFGLRLMDLGVVSAAELAEHFRAVGQGSVPDQVVALEERVLSRSPDRAEVVSRLAGEARFVPLDCPECRARLRAPCAQAPRHSLEQAGVAACCPLCDEPIVAGRRLLFFDERPAARLVAAEAEGPYHLGPSVRRFAHFELTRLVGRGGAGRVYEARNVRSGRTVALKLLDFHPLESSAASLARLRREAPAASAIVHEHVVRVYDLGLAEGLSFIEMEFVPGVSLREHVRRRGSLPATEACRLCIEALGGLAAVHGAGIVHRDVKPDNILMDEQGRARLTDFGLSRFLEETTTFGSSDKVVGSPHFMAPEQWRGEAVSAQTDLYAMGLVLYYCLTGRLPYEGGPLVSLMYRHLHEPLVESAAAYPFGDYLAQVIRRATEKAPADRFAGAEEFAAALQAFLEGSVVQH